MQNPLVPYYLIAVIAGVAVPILAAISAMLGQTIGSPHWAALILCVVAFVAVLGITLAVGAPMPALADLAGAKWWHYTAGVFFMIYVVSITYVAPKIGVGNAIIFVVVAQIFTATVIDHFGLLGAEVQLLDWKRALGVALLVAGVALTRSPSVASGTTG